MQPGNVLVSDNYDAKVADFGVSLSAKRGKNKQLESEMTKVEGTDFYMAPELFNISSSQLLFSLDSDIYAFGIVLYELFNRCNLLYDIIHIHTHSLTYTRIHTHTHTLHSTYFCL